MKPVRVGVIGVGRMGGNHCRVYSSIRAADLVGIYDADRQSGASVARQYGVPHFEEVDELLEEVDAVSVATPTPSHFDLATQCLERGVHVLVEKPLADTLEHAEALTDMAASTPRVLMVGHIERFNPAYRELKTVLEHMTVMAAEFRRLSAFESSNTDVDVVFDLMVHDTDLALDLVGREPDSVSAYGLSAMSDRLDHVVAHLGFGSGPIITLTASRITEQKIRSIEVTALEAYLEGDLLNKNISVHRRTIGEYLSHNKRGVKYRQESIIERIHVPIFEPLFLELQHFIDCIVEGKPCMVPAVDGFKALRIADAIQRSLGNGHVLLPAFADRVPRRADSLQPLGGESQPAG